jgi:hypothetical protein
MLAAHIAQATVDPTLIGGEAAIQTMSNDLAEKYSIPEHIQKELEPGLLLKTILGADVDYNVEPMPEASPYEINIPQDNTAVEIPLVEQQLKNSQYDDHKKETNPASLQNAPDMSEQFNWMAPGNNLSKEPRVGVSAPGLLPKKPVIP